jgi:hypothetical protein
VTLTFAGLVRSRVFIQAWAIDDRPMLSQAACPLPE